jgi:hypothetical protein
MNSILLRRFVQRGDSDCHRSPGFFQVPGEDKLFGSGDISLYRTALGLVAQVFFCSLAGLLGG